MRPAQRISDAIHFVRGQRVMIDRDLAALYGVAVKALNQAVRRNLERFPPDFMLQLTWEEAERLRSQTVTLKGGPAIASGPEKRGAHLKYRPLAFTEQGVAMLSSVLRSARAVIVNVEIMRAFVRLREALATNSELAKRIDQLEARIDARLAGQDKAIVEILQAIRQLMSPPTTGPKRRIGFV
jgi:ATP-dependent Clp protease ATP-binding subunit ClpA